MFKFINFPCQLWLRAVWCCIVDGWVDHGCNDVFLVWRIPNCRLTTQKQLTQRPVTAPRPLSTTPPRHWSIVPQLTLLPATTPTPRSITLPRPDLHHIGRVLHDYVYCPILLNHQGRVLHDYVCCLLHRGSQVLLCTHLLTTPMYKVVLLCSQLQQRGSSWLLNQNGWKLHQSAQELLCPDLHNHKLGGQVLRSTNLLHRSCLFVLRWTEISHWCSSLLHRYLCYT
jgi:hypothetical protein